MITTKKDLMELFQENSPEIKKQHIDKDPDDIKVLDYGDPHKTKGGQIDNPMPPGTGFAKEGIINEDEQFPYVLTVVNNGKTIEFNKFNNKAAAMVAKKMIDPSFKPKIIYVGEVGGQLKPDSFKDIRINENNLFTNKTIASLIDEICNVQTGYGVIDDLKFVNEVLHEGKLDEVVLEKIINEALDEYYSMTENLSEAEYKGRKVKLSKIMRGDRKKYKVHVKNDKGNVVKVEFGDPNMEIKRDNAARRKSFRARHRCDNPGPRWKARYWACKTWSKTPVSKMV
jgi:hypothetical protein